MLLAARITFISAYSYLLYDSVQMNISPYGLLYDDVLINISPYGLSIIWQCVDQYQSIWSVYYMMMCGSISVSMVCLLYDGV
jgi:hypothetical protein